MNFATTWKARNFTNFISYRTNSGMDRSKPLILYLYVYERERERERGKIPDLSQADMSYYQIHKIQPITKYHVLLLGFAITT